MIYTVTGTIVKGELGATLSHEHLAWDGDETYACQLYFDRFYDEGKNDHLCTTLLPVFNKLYESGCRTIVETSPPIGGQNLKLMQKLSRASGINIIANTGWIFSKYVYLVHNEKELAQRWVEDFRNGLDTIDGIVVRPGHIKLLLENGPLIEVDRKMIKAAIIASKATGMPVHCHILEAQKAEEVLDLLIKEEFDFSRFLWAHASKEGNFEVIEKAISKGAWVGFDMIRRKEYEKAFNLLKEALKRGYKDRILLSQDYDFYEEVTNHGENHPCASFFTDFLPYCTDNGISSDTISDIITLNPGEFFDI